MEATMQIIRVSNALCRINMQNVHAGWKQNFFLISDIHLESPACLLHRVKEDLEYAKSIDAQVLINGDLFDATGGRDDPRRNPNNIRPQLNKTDYLDKTLDFVDEFLSPYAHMILYMGLGNHENIIRKHHGTNLIERLVERWRARDISQCINGGYGGFIRFAVYDDTHETPTASFRMYVNHGKGSTSAPVTRGMIETNRQAVWLDNIDLVWNGHNHQDYWTKLPLLSLNNKDQLENKHIAFVRTPGYLMPWQDSGEWEDDYAIQSNMGPSATGGIVLRLEYKRINGDRVLEDYYEDRIK